MLPKRLLSLVLETYQELYDEPPRELFIHGQTYFNDEEWNAFCAAAPKETNVVGVRIRTTGGETKLFRDGDYPVLRGTALLLDQQTAYLWTTGHACGFNGGSRPEMANRRSDEARMHAPFFCSAISRKSDRAGQGAACFRTHRPPALC